MYKGLALHCNSPFQWGVSSTVQFRFTNTRLCILSFPNNLWLNFYPLSVCHNSCRRSLFLPLWAHLFSCPADLNTAWRWRSTNPFCQLPDKHFTLVLGWFVSLPTVSFLQIPVVTDWNWLMKSFVKLGTCLQEHWHKNYVAFTEILFRKKHLCLTRAPEFVYI